MTYFVTGAPASSAATSSSVCSSGGKDLRARTRGLDRQARRADQALDQTGSDGGRPRTERIVKVIGDLQEPKLGVSDKQVAELKARSTTLPPRRDLRHDADEESNEKLNVEGTATRPARERDRAGDLPSVSSSPRRASTRAFP